MQGVRVQGGEEVIYLTARFIRLLVRFSLFYTIHSMCKHHHLPYTHLHSTFIIAPQMRYMTSINRVFFQKNRAKF